MRKNFFTSLLKTIPVLIACLACQANVEKEIKADLDQDNSDPKIIITASVEPSVDDTKSALESGTKVVWQTGDQIKVFNQSNPEGVVYTLLPAYNGKTSGCFSGPEIQGGAPYYAVYPATAGVSLAGENVSVTIPQSQALAAGSFGSGANVAITKVDDITVPLYFKNVLGAVKISVSSEIQATRVRIQTKADEALWGSGTVTMNGDTPVLNLDGGTVDNQIVEAVGNASGKEFYLMLPAGTLSGGFMIQVAENGGLTMVKAAKSAAKNQVQRSAILPMPEFDFQGQFQSAFLNLSELPFGYYSGIQPGGSLSAFTFNKLTGQYATKVETGTSRYFRLLDFSVGKMYAFTTPYSLTLGGSYDVSVDSVVGSTYYSEDGSYILLQKTSNAAWFISSDKTNGFIILMEE